MMYIFEVSNDDLDEAALLVPIYAESSDEAWGKYYRQEGTRWANVRMQDTFKQGKRLGTNDKRVGKANDQRYAANRVESTLKEE